MTENESLLSSFSNVIHSVIDKIDRTISDQNAADEVEEETEERCIICFVKETNLNKLTKLPCKNRCNYNYVHKKCIFEWTERQKTKGTCPLCRGKLQTIDYRPIDYLKTTLITRSLLNRKTFCLSPIPKEAGMVRCYVKVKNNPWWGSAYLYEFYLQEVSVKKYPFGPLPGRNSPYEGDILLMTARKRLNFLNLNHRYLNLNFRLNSTVDISLSKNYSSSCSDYLGKVEASTFTGLEYNLFCKVFTKQAKLQLFQLSKKPSTGYMKAATVRFTQNRFGAVTGPRKLSFSLPGIEKMSHNKILATITGSNRDVETNILNYQPAPLNEPNEALGKSIEEPLAPFMSKQESLLTGNNKKPCWLDEIQAFSLDFSGRVTIASNKNFQIEFDKETVRDNEELKHLSSCGTGDEIVLQFGKVLRADECRENVNIYTLDFKFPLSPLQALGLCISSCDRKMACA